MFVDPFGWSNASLTTLRKIFELNSVEMLFNLMTDAINRFATSHPDPDVQAQFVRLLGVEGIQRVARSTSRHGEIRSVFVENMKRLARYVLPFTMVVNGRNHNDLIWLGNHVRGNVIMKEVMYDVSDDVVFRFNDRKFNPRIEELDEDMLAERVFKELLIRELSTVESAAIETLLVAVDHYPEYLRKHAKHALRNAEVRNEIVVDSLKKDGSKRRAKSFPDGTIIRLRKQ